MYLWRMDNFSRQELEMRFRAIVETAVDGIVTIDAQGIIESANRAACRLFGYEESELVGGTINRLMPAHHSDAHDNYLARYLQTGERRIIGIGREVVGLRKDGSTFPFWLSVSELRFEGRVVFTGLVHDISELKNAQTELQSLNSALESKVHERTEQLAEVVNDLLAANKRLEHEVHERQAAERALQQKQEELLASLARERELGELKSRFVSLASHEFRTPLSTVLSSAALVKRYAELGNTEKQEFHLEKIRAAVGHLTGILNDFLSLTKLEEGRVENNPEWFDFAEFCAEVAEELRGLAKPGQDILCQNLAPGLAIYQDKRILRNILYNLISNGLKYSERDVTCTVRHEPEALKIEIADRGIGIPESEQKHLFERFFRAKNASNIQGTGLGLNIVRRYADIIGAQLVFVSREGEGTVFTLSISLKQ